MLDEFVGPLFQFSTMLFIVSIKLKANFESLIIPLCYGVTLWKSSKTGSGLIENYVHLTEFVSPLCWFFQPCLQFGGQSLLTRIFDDTTFSSHAKNLVKSRIWEGKEFRLSSHKPRTTTTTQIIFLKITLLTLRMVIWCSKGT